MRKRLGIGSSLGQSWRFIQVVHVSMRGLASPRGSGLCRSNNAASLVEGRRSKCLTRQQCGSRFAVDQAACYSTFGNAFKWFKQAGIPYDRKVCAKIVEEP